MEGKSVGFIGAGRITRILLGGFRRAGKLPGKIVVSDMNGDILQRLKNDFPEIDMAPNGNRQAARQDVVFFALHPPVMGSILTEIRSDLKPSCILVSLAPKLTLGACPRIEIPIRDKKHNNRSPIFGWRRDYHLNPKLKG